MHQEVILFAVSCLILVKSSSYAVSAASKLARAVHLTEFATSFLLVALISALPETFIAVIAALKGDPSLGFGTLLGGNIADLTLILGLVALAGHPLKIHSSIIKKDLYFALLTLLPIFLGLDGKLGRIDAAILFAAGATFLAVLVGEQAYFRKPFEDGDHLAKHIILFVASTALMIVSANYVVTSSHNIALAIGIPSLLIGLILTALGTTLPEFTFSLQSIRKGHSELAIGDILGVVVVDATIVVAITAFITPIIINTTFLSIIGAFTAFAAVFALLFMRTDGTLSKNEATALIFFYIAFVIVQVLIS